MASIHLRELQVGDQSAFGTAVTPTVLIPGVEPASMSIGASLLNTIPAHSFGYASRGTYVIDTVHESTWNISDIIATYEFLGYFLDGLSEATPAGAGPYTRAYDGPTATAASPRFQTWVSLNTSDLIFGAIGGVLAGFSLTSEWGQPVKFSPRFMARNIASDALADLDAPADAAVTEMLNSQLTVYVDAFAGTIGSTALGTVWSVNIDVDCGRNPLQYVGSQYPAGFFDSNAWTVTGTITADCDATTGGWVTSALSATQTKLIRLLWSNGGATTALRSYQMDIPVALSVPNLYGDINGRATIDINFTNIDEGDPDDPGSGEVDGHFASVLTNNTADLYP